jgi:molecular chaperone DnaK
VRVEVLSRLIRFGIDLGTTNSCIALCEGTDVRVFPNNDQMNVTPSVVRILKSGRLIVGSRAYHALRDDPDNIVTEFKRWMGQSDKRSFPASGRLMSAEELSAEVLKSLREDVRRLTSEDIDAAVVTVPAAFGALQCEATARAARLAGLLESPLLQEPIAAAIAYGITPGARDQKWMIFDLGGGTLDIAIVSTKAGRLAVLEHQGNNLLGGKDIDRGLVENIFLPCLADSYSLPDPTLDRRGFDCLIRRLVRKAEETKIELSTSNEVVVSLVDLGEDEEGSSIEAEIILTRGQLEDEVQPMLKECLKLAESAVAGAHLTGSDIDRILLVGGPTQMPILRRSLEERIGAPVDFSLDPMTVVARGAAIYAASIERTIPSTRPLAVSDKLAIKLAFEPVSASVQCPVTGMIEKSPEVGDYEVKIDSDSGYWSSGWLSAKEGFFEIVVMLQEGKENRFWLYVRDRTGRIIDCEPSQLSIRHGLEVGAPPLPHTISVEIIDSKGRPVLEPVFIRNTPLPSKQAKKYRASHALRPGEPDTSIAIKLWEGEEFADPEANSWVGNMLIRSEDLRRAIPEGAEIEVFIKIDSSRLISVEAFVPY